MSLTSFVVSRNWASDPLRAALSLLGIALGVAIVVAIYVMDHNTIQSRLHAQQPERGRVDLEVRPIDPRATVAAVRSELAQRPGVAAVAVWSEARGVLHGGREPLDVAVFGLDPLPGGAFAHYAVGSGRDLSVADGNDAVLLGEEAARRLDAGVGARLSLRRPAGQQRVECRDGRLVVIPPPPGQAPFEQPVTVAGILTPDRLGRRNFGDVVVCAHALAVELRGGVGADLFQLQRNYGADLDRLRADLRASYEVVDARSAMIGEAADERAFRNGLKVLGCLALLLGMFVVFQTLSHSLLARVRQLGLLRCLGASRGALLRIFLGDALALGIVGGGLGIALGLLLARLCRHFKISSLGLEKQWETFEVPVLPVLWTGCLGVLFTLAGALFPLWRARQVPAQAILEARGLGAGNDLLRGVNVWLVALLVLALPLAYLAMTPLVSEEGRETLIVLLQLAGMLLGFGLLLLVAPVMVALFARVLLLPLRTVVPLAGYLADRVVARQSPRLAAAVCGLAAVLVALLGLRALTGSLRAEVDEFGAAALAQRLFLRGPAVGRDAALQLGSIPGVAAVEPIEGEISGGFLLRGLDVTAAAGRDGALEGDQELVRRYSDPRRRTLVASRRLADQMRWRRGDLVPMHDRNGDPVTYEVLAISDRSGYTPSERAWAVTAPHWLRQDFCVAEQCVECVTLRLERRADPAVVRDRARKLLAGIAKARTGDEILDYHRRDVDRDFLLFDLLLSLMLVLAGVGLVNGMTIAALGRRRELGVLRALGVGARTLGATFLIEGVLVGLLAAALAIALAIPIAHVLIAGLNQVAAMSVPLVLPTNWFWRVPGIGVGIGILAAILPARAALRQSPAEAVRYE